MQSDVDRQREFVKAVYIRDFRNTVTKVSFGIQLILSIIDGYNSGAGAVPGNEKTAADADLNVKSVVEGMANSIQNIIFKIDTMPKAKIIPALQEYRDLEDTEVYMIIQELWISCFPDTKADLLELYELTSSANPRIRFGQKRALLERLKQRFEQISILLKKYEKILNFKQHLDILGSFKSLLEGR